MFYNVTKEKLAFKIQTRHKTLSISRLSNTSKHLNSHYLPNNN